MRPVRDQVLQRHYTLDSLIDDDHPVRAIWQFVLGCDLEALSAPIKSREGHPGRPAIDPAILFALWLWATVDGVASARRIDRLCQRDDTYRWICGSVGVNYHAIADFRAENGAWLDAQLTRSVAALINTGVIDLSTVAQDGMRVRAHAKAASFHRQGTLEQALALAEAQVQSLSAERTAAAGLGPREAAARRRAARERHGRLQQALATMAELQRRGASEVRRSESSGADDRDEPPGSGGGGEKALAEVGPKRAKKPRELRVSRTDPEARVMKMGDGGFRPAYNLQFAVDVGTGLIVGLDLVNFGSDINQMQPMHEQLIGRYAKSAATWLADGGFTNLAAIETLSNAGVCVIAPPPTPRKSGIDPNAPKRGDSEAVAAWRVRMGTEQAKVRYRRRAATVECVNARARQQGLDRFEVVGSLKARAVGLIHALAQHAMGRARLARQRSLALAEVASLG